MSARVPLDPTPVRTTEKEPTRPGWRDYWWVPVAVLCAAGFLWLGLVGAVGGSKPAPVPRFPEYLTQCDAQTGNRMYWWPGLGQVAVVNDPACPLVLVE